MPAAAGGSARQMPAHVALVALALVLAAPSGVAFAADRPRNERPLYGEIPPRPAERAADEHFIAEALKLAPDRKTASDKSVALGFAELFQRRDPAAAIKRFNQAWLLDADNGAALHGMALVLIIRDNDGRSAEPLFARAVASPRQLPGSFMDYGRFLLESGRPAEAVPVLVAGRARFPAAQQGIAEMEGLLAAAYAESGQWAQACPLARSRQGDLKPPLTDHLRAIAANPACR